MGKEIQNFQFIFIGQQYLEIYLQSNSRFYLIFRVKTAIFVALVSVMYSISYRIVKLKVLNWASKGR